MIHFFNNEYFLNMTDIITLHQQKKAETDFLKEFETNKTIPQNLFYTTDGAESFYMYRNPGIAQIKWQDEIRFFEKQEFWDKTKTTAFVSLGCGNSAPEKMFLRHICEQGFCLDYFGVDSSEAMLKLAAKNLSVESFNRQFFLADFTLPEFKHEFFSYVKNYDTILYATLGGTFGNFNQSHIAESMSRLLEPNNFLYLDIVPLSDSPEKNNELKKRYADLPKNYHNFFAGLLEKFSISMSNGKIISREIADRSVDALTITFFFVPGQKLQTNFSGESVTLFPEDQIELMSIRAYNISSLKEFMKSYGFDFIDDYVPDAGNLPHLWQRLLFQRK